MNPNLKIYNLALCLLLLTACNFSKKDSDKKDNKTDDKQSVETYHTSEDTLSLSVDQDYIEVSSDQRNTLVPYRLDSITNYFKLDSAYINLQIPITTTKLSINDAVDISSNKVNAIVVHLDGNNGSPTLGDAVTHFLLAKIPISSIKDLDLAQLRRDNKLKVIVMHNDVFNPNYEEQFENCIVNQGAYVMDPCNIIEDKTKPFEDTVQPMEKDGGILGGR